MVRIVLVLFEPRVLEKSLWEFLVRIPKNSQELPIL